MFTIRCARVMTPAGLRAAHIIVRDGRVAALTGLDDRPAGIPSIDAGDHVVLPGLVDTHVHINEPGRTAWEGFDSATRAAAAGGVTTLVDMPLNSIPAATTVQGLETKIRAATGQCHVDVGFWGGVVPGNTGELRGLAAAGVLGFKCFLSPSGVDEFPHVSEADLRQALPVVAELGLPLLVHAELPLLLRVPAGDPRQYRTWLASRPAEAEQAAIELLIHLARDHGARIHIVHLASADALPAIRRARAEGLSISVETCPHYLTFAAEEIADGATAFKCAPPIREQAHRERLWDALREGSIDLVASDHSPAPPALKQLERGNFVEAWGGIASVQLGLAAIWTGVCDRAMPVESIASWMADAPARLAGLSAAKGTIAVGGDADFVFWEPDTDAAVDAAALFHRHAVCPYHGRRLRGRVVKTMLRGDVVFDGDGFGAPRGRCLRGSDSREAR
jgi:allantoinase